MALQLIYQPSLIPSNTSRTSHTSHTNPNLIPPPQRPTSNATCTEDPSGRSPSMASLPPPPPPQARAYHKLQPCNPRTASPHARMASNSRLALPTLFFHFSDGRINYFPLYPSASAATAGCEWVSARVSGRVEITNRQTQFYVHGSGVGLLGTYVYKFSYPYSNWSVDISYT